MQTSFTTRHYPRALPGPHRAVVEACGSWYWLADLFASQGVKLKLAQAWYQAKLRAKGRPIAQTLVAKELARIPYHVLRGQVNFNGTFRGVPIHNVKHVRSPRRASPNPN